MAAPKGTRPPNAGKGRVKGSQNKVTADVREAIGLFARQNISQLEGWLKRVAAKNPAKAAEILLRALEYHIPKLERSELTGADGKPLVPQTEYERALAGELGRMQQDIALARHFQFILTKAQVAGGLLGNSAADESR